MNCLLKWRKNVKIKPQNSRLEEQITIRMASLLIQSCFSRNLDFLLRKLKCIHSKYRVCHGPDSSRNGGWAWGPPDLGACSKGACCFRRLEQQNNCPRIVLIFMRRVKLVLNIPVIEVIKSSSPKGRCFYPWPSTPGTPCQTPCRHGWSEGPTFWETLAVTKQKKTFTTCLTFISK